MVWFKGFWPATIWRGAAFHFLPVFSKKKIVWKLWLWFSKKFHQRVFLWRNMKNSEIFVLTANSRYLQTTALKFPYNPIHLLYMQQVCMQTCMPREGVCIINVWGYTEILPFVLYCFANTLNYGISSVCGPHFHWKLFSKTALLHCTTQTGTQSLQVSSFLGGSSHDVTAAILVFQNNKAAAILVFQTNPVGVEHFSYVKNFFYFNKFA